jgi:predicted HTH transcriptional regulator
LYFETKGVPINRKTFKNNLGLLTDNGKYNVLAQLLSDDSHITLRFALFAGNDKTSTMYSVKEFGYTCILYSLDQVLDYGKMMNIPQADERNRKTVRNEVPLFNEKAFEEAVINAFVHNRWIDGNAPMFTGFRDRIEILSRGNLPPKQTFEGFFAGESVPVNKALSDIFIKLHITEHTGRGIPRITNVYGRESIKFNENSIMVTIPYERLGSDIYGIIDKQVNAQVDAQVDAQVNAQVDFENDEDKIMSFCETAKSMVELMEFLGVKDRRTVRKILNPMIAQGRIARTIPDKPNSRLQKYIAIK